MTLKQRPYSPADFAPIRNLLSDTFRAWGQQINWRIERWNWCRYSCVPYLCNWPRNLHPTWEESQAGIRWWEEHIRIWEDNGRIIGVVNTEATDLGECWIQRRPGYPRLLPEALVWAEEHLAKSNGSLRVWAMDHDDALRSALTARGYVCLHDDADPTACYAIRRPPASTLPEGYTIASMAEGGDPQRRAEGIGRGFGHEDPLDWGTVTGYRYLLNAPDYDPTLDLHVIAPDGRYVANCIVWHDAPNQIGILEPVATHPDFRRMGLGRAVIYEGIRRVRPRGATEIWVGSDQAFYQSIGFVVQFRGHAWARPVQ